jgi:alkylation response protein AidB-like acyl-CoA dehydrogenase
MPHPPFAEEHDALRRTVREFCQQKLAPHAEEWDKAGEFPRSVFKDLADLGLLGIRYPEEIGGLGLDWWTSIAFMEEMVHARSGGLMMSVLVDTDMATGIIDEMGTDDQKREFLAPVISGDWVAALGVTEPDAGSDVANIRTTARKDGGDYVISGSKTFITNGSFADFVTMIVRTGEPGFGGISIVLVPTASKGFTVGRHLDKLGTRAVSSCELHFDEVRVPQRNLIGEENMGFLYLMNNFQGERVAASVMAYAGAILNIRDAIAYGEQRKAFGRPIMKFQWWRHKFADHLASLEAARYLTYAAVQKMVDGENPTREVSMAKLFAGELCQRVAYDCLQFHGGYGYCEEYNIARSFRDARLITIGGGTSEVMREIIAKWEGF